MAVLLENVTNCVWQAFEVLQQDKSGFVHKSKLKVLTANIGTLLDLYGVEKGLEHFRSTTTLNFDQYKYYLQKEVFSALPNKLPLPELRDYEARIGEVCWLVCRKKFVSRENKVLVNDSVFQIFRIFCLLAELVPDSHNENIYQVLLHPSEVYSIAQNLANSLGCPWDDEDFTNLSISMGSFRLTPFIAVLESRSLVGVKDNYAISEAVTNIYQTLVEDVIKKGYMSKKGYIFPTMREYWFVLRPSELSYYKTRTEKDRCGSLPIERGSKVEPKSDGYRILLYTAERVFEFGTTDYMSRVQWISALQLAAEHSSGHQSYQRLQANKRKAQRAGRIQEMIKARAQLQQERSARQAAEGQAKELEAAVKAESRKLNEMEALRANLERLLEEETQAKHDEEIVRALQAKVLAEEWEKREELERLQDEQRALLDEERGKRQEFEELQLSKENQLRSAEDRLTQLEDERQALDEQLKLALGKIKQSEDRREVLETQLYQVAPYIREGDRVVRRAHSFMPSTKERPVLLEIRPATLRRPTKN